MNTYIFLTFSIIGVGGSQIYTRNKALYLKEHGWNVVIVSALEGEILIEDLKLYEFCIIPELRFKPHIYSKKVIGKILKKISAEIPTKGDVIIESHSISLSFWGELLAQRVNGLNFVFTLEEHNNVDYATIPYLQYKLTNNSLVGISINSISKIKELNCRPDTFLRLPAYCNNVIEDIPNVYNINQSAKIRVGIIGRLNKPFIKSICSQLREVINNDLGTTYQIIFIGGGSGADIISIRKVFEVFSNVDLTITGFLYPIPLDLLNQIDFFISSAGSARVPMQIGKPCISIDGDDLKPIGIVGLTTDNSLYRNKEKEPVKPLNYFIEEIQKWGDDSPMVAKGIAKRFDYAGHLERLESCSRGNYFDIYSIILPFKDILYSRIKMHIYNSVGNNLYNIIFNFAKKWKQKLFML